MTDTTTPLTAKPRGGEFVEDAPLETILQGIPDFEPVAYYDKHLDAIRVQTMDCSIWEDRLDRILTVYHANHHQQADGLNDVVGFAIKGVRHLLREIGLDDREQPLKLAAFLDKLFKLYPSRSTKFVLEYYQALRPSKLDEIDIQALHAA